jgi:hypothetical protein
MASDLFERACKDGEDAAQVMRERDELRRRDAESHQQILILQGELEKEKGLKLAIQEKVIALAAKAHQDATQPRWPSSSARREMTHARPSRGFTQSA